MMVWGWWRVWWVVALCVCLCVCVWEGVLYLQVLCKYTSTCIGVLKQKNMIRNSKMAFLHLNVFFYVFVSSPLSGIPIEYIGGIFHNWIEMRFYSSETVSLKRDALMSVCVWLEISYPLFTPCIQDRRPNYKFRPQDRMTTPLDTCTPNQRRLPSPSLHNWWTFCTAKDAGSCPGPGTRYFRFRAGLLWPGWEIKLEVNAQITSGNCYRTITCAVSFPISWSSPSS